MIWLLDTNVLTHAQRGSPPSVRERLRSLSPEELAISAITIAELWYGAAKSAEPARKRALWARAIEPYEILSFDQAAAEQHGDLRYALRHQPIGERDLLIASIALAHDLVLVTANIGEFGRVPGLRHESWVEADE